MYYLYFGHFSNILDQDLIVYTADAGKCGHGLCPWELLTNLITKCQEILSNARKTTWFHGSKIMPHQIFQNYSSQRHPYNWTGQQSEAWALFCSESSVHVTPLMKDKLLKKFEVKGAVARPWAPHHLCDTSWRYPFFSLPEGIRTQTSKTPVRISVLVV